MNERPEPASASPLAGSSQSEAASTVELIARVRGGDAAARAALEHRCLPPLRRWARGRLPAFARGMEDTDDLVQDTVVSALARLDTFQPGHEGALQAHLRQALAHRITDVVRRRMSRPEPADGPPTPAAPPASPLDQAVGAHNVARYDAALARLGDGDRQAIVARLELQYSYEQLADALGTPTADAARVAVVGAMGRLALEMQSLLGQ